MLSLLILWVVLGAGTYLLGLHLVHFFDREHLLDRLGDRAIISLTLGCLTLAVLLSVFVLFGPLNAVPGVLILAVAAAGVAARPAVRREAMSTARLVLQPRFALPVTLVTLGVALAASDPVGWYDSGLYHYPFVKWMREYGMIPGVALVHDAFGQSSIWYPMTAFLSDGSLRDRVGGVWAGFLFVAACSYLLLALLRIADGRARHADWYVAVVIPLSVQPFLVILNSTSQDVPQLFVPIVLAACVLLLEERWRHSGRPDAERVFDARFIVLLLAAGATAVKLNGVPLLGVIGLWYLGWPLRPRRVLGAIVAGVAALGSGVAMSFIATGCPVFPSGAGCVPTSWTFDQPYIDYGRQVFYEFIIRGGVRIAPAGADLENWKADWVKENGVTIGGIVLTMVAGAALIWRGRLRAIPGGRVILACAAAGIAYVLVMAPAARYMLSYLPMAAGLLAAWMGMRANRMGAWRRALPQLATVALLAGTLLRSQRVNLVSGLRQGDLGRVVVTDSFPLVRPPLFPTPPMHARRWNDIEYLSPVDTTRVPDNQLRNYTGRFDQRLVSVRCGAAPPPCTPYFAYDDVVFRDPARGIAGGFRRRNPGAPGHAYIGLRGERLSDGQQTSPR